MTGISANIMCGQEGYFGTSAFDVMLDVNEISKLSAKNMQAQYDIDGLMDDLENSDDYCSTNNIIMENNSENVSSKNTGNMDDDYDMGF
jgi:DNA-directed RNA polymerase II subunit RPB1